MSFDGSIGEQPIEGRAADAAPQRQCAHRIIRAGVACATPTEHITEDVCHGVVVDDSRRLAAASGAL